MNVYEAKELSDEYRECEDADQFPSRLPKDDDARRTWLKESRWAGHLYTRHCRNNFMKALETLKQVAETTRSGHGECIEWLDSVIKELEEIP